MNHVLLIDVQLCIPGFVHIPLSVSLKIRLKFFLTPVRVFSTDTSVSIIFTKVATSLQHPEMICWVKLFFYQLLFQLCAECEGGQTRRVQSQKRSVPAMSPLGTLRKPLVFYICATEKKLEKLAQFIQQRVIDKLHTYTFSSLNQNLEQINKLRVLLGQNTQRKE